MGFKKTHIIAILANIIFVGGNIIYFTSHKNLPANFSYFINFGCIYLFSLTGLLLSKITLIRTLSILSCGISSAKIFYAIFLTGMEDIDSRRMVFLIITILFMIMHLLAWLVYDFKYKKWTY